MTRAHHRRAMERQENQASVLARVRPRAVKAQTIRHDSDEASMGRNDQPVADRLLDKWAIEERTSLDITTIYRKIKAGTFPLPVRVGLRRVAWRESDITAWQDGLTVGVNRA